MNEQQTPLYVLKLRRKQDWDSKLLRLRVGWTLKLVVAPGIYAENVRVFTEFPAEGELYSRGKLRELTWISKGNQPCWDPDRYIVLPLIAAGAFRLVWTFDNNSTGPLEGHGYFVVDPDLGYSPDSISCQTVITKLLGPLTQWRSRLAVSHNCGYNMIHFTPPQQLGSSRSAYSISNQLRLDLSYLPPGRQFSEVPVTFTNRCNQQKTLNVDSAFLEVRQELQNLRHQCGILSIVDVVWNHTSFDTPWLIQHPEAGYNLMNSPHLRPAYALDVVLSQFSQEIVNGDWENVGLHPTISSEHDIQMICSRLTDSVLPRAKLWEYFSVDVEVIVKDFKNSVYHLNGGEHARPEGKFLSIVQDPQYRRLGSTVDATLTLELFNIYQPDTVCFEERIEQCCTELRSELRKLNYEVEHRVQGQLHQAVQNLAASMRYQFLEHHGPRRRKFTLTDRYFVVAGGGPDLSWVEMEGARSKNVLAHNGWVMNADPLVNFAEKGSQVYFQRELIVWADSVKLRYGNSPADSPWLWDHMTQYTQTMAWLFDGFRLDNCHNTPLNVAESLLDAAREVYPNLYLVAELFTPSEERDNYYVNRLGINSLVREAMFAPNPRELGRLVYKYGGDPVASFFSSSFIKPSTAHAMFIDATHDNDPGHILSRCVQDALPNTALVSIASCANGGCRGYDELIPHKIDVVTEKRFYSSWSTTSPPSGLSVNDETGIIGAKKLLNDLHRELAEKKYNEIFVDQVTEEIVAVTRHCPANHKSYILMAHTAFHHPPYWATPTTKKPYTRFSDVPPLYVQGRIKEIYIEGYTVAHDPAPPDFKQSPSYINGLQSHYIQIQSHIPLSKSKMCRLLAEDNSSQEVSFVDFCPGSIIIFEVELLPEATKSTQVIRSFLECDKASSEGCGLWSQLTSLSSSLSLIDLNYILYRCDNEEKDEGNGGGVYVVPGAGPLVYCGLQGIMSMMEPVRVNNDLGHPLCDNLRSGDWLPGYTINRLKLKTSTKKIADILGVVFEHLSTLPRYLIPSYFDAIVSKVYKHMITTTLSKLNKFVNNGSSLVSSLTLGSIQMYGHCHSATLPPLLPSMQPLGSIAAGLPHFSTGFMRCWGRDTFIALRGLLLVTGRFQEAEETILAFAACLRHGLIPNLLSEGRNPRYNCRDAVWWWLQSIQDYSNMASPNGTDILQEPVRRLFPSDDSEGEFDGENIQSLAEIIQEALERHSIGISFTERGAGSGLDRDMTPPGFNVDVYVDWTTGFVRGGNQYNCGTWMDKVGESGWAGNKGMPATPRDGSPVELVGLCYSTLVWLADLNQRGIYPFTGVYTTPNKAPGSPYITFKQWSVKLRSNFEKFFWIPLDFEESNKKEGEAAGYIHQRGIYKDTVNSTHKYTDYQLRPNFPIAMAVAPGLFTPSNALTALKRAEEIIVGPLGMRTLDPHDYQYNGYYINSVDSENYQTARGFNYHQGPEWLWPIGYFLRAKLKFADQKEVAVTCIHQALSAHAQALEDSPWSGLPELTNKDGVECADSCPVQAWSMATLLDVLYDLAN